MFAERAEDGLTFLQDCLLQGRPTPTVVFALADRLSLTAVADGLLLADPSHQVFCQFNAAAALILSCCDQCHTTSDIAARLLPLMPEWEAAAARRFVLTTLWHLRSLDLIRIVSALPPNPAPGHLESPLREVHLFLTNRCPLDCVHCCIAREARREMPTKRILDLLNQLQYLGLPHLLISGGEPLLRADFFQIAAAARALGLSFELTSSGQTIDRKRAARLAELSPLSVGLSLYSADPAVHDRITRVPGSWQRTRRAMDDLLAAGVRPTLKCMVMRLNEDAYAGVADLAEGLGLTYTFDPGITCRLDGCRLPLQYRLTASQLKMFAQTRFWRRTAWRKLNPTDRPCHAGTGRCAIGAQGDVSPCVLFPLGLGSITARPLREILNGQEMQRLRRLTIGNLGHCADCAKLSHCAPCPGLAYLEHGDYRVSPRWCCAITAAQQEAPGCP